MNMQIINIQISSIIVDDSDLAVVFHPVFYSADLYGIRISHTRQHILILWIVQLLGFEASGYIMEETRRATLTHINLAGQTDDITSHTLLFYWK